ncbi:AAC(3) family N-acetyltransferase [Psychrobacillus sp. FSL H8-0483]|uniref:AAC(3) family N-acetyltransferase n=1 Tax=Psychrobacillus sp. FSL H8-0483 TaxID=2921389 RepID=UPI003159DB68
MRQKLREIIRYLIKSRENEKISDAIDRHKTRLQKKINRKKISEEDFLKIIKSMGIKSGDTVMLHASWRKFYNYSGTPKSLIENFIELLGNEGTLLMPCYGDNRKYFDVKNTRSTAGVLSEEFRRYPGVKRSECSHFSVCAFGKDADIITKYHIKSEFGFDNFSPYYIFSQKENSKVVMLGMGKYPIKLTLIHCIEYIFKDVYPYFNRYLSKKYTATVIINDGTITKREMIEGNYAKLYKKNIKKVYKNLPKDKKFYGKIGNIQIRIIFAKKGFDEISKLVVSGKSMLNPPKVEKNSFKPYL